MTDIRADLKEVYKRLAEAYNKLHKKRDKDGELDLDKLPRSSFGKQPE